jgi:hypothetical protein
VLVKNLIVVESRRSRIEADFAAQYLLTVSRSGLVSRPKAVVVQVSDVVFDTKDGLSIIDVLACGALRNDLLFGASSGLKQTNIGVFS